MKVLLTTLPAPFSPAMGLGSAVSSPNGIQRGAQAAKMFSYILDAPRGLSRNLSCANFWGHGPLGPLKFAYAPFRRFVRLVKSGAHGQWDARPTVTFPPAERHRSLTIVPVNVVMVCCSILTYVHNYVNNVIIQYS